MRSRFPRQARVRSTSRGAALAALLAFQALPTVVFFAALVFRLGHANLYLNELPDAALVNRE